MNAKTISVKCELEDDIRRFQLEVEGEQGAFDALRARVCELFGVESVLLKFKDDEGDLVTLSSDPELATARSLCPTLLRVVVIPVDDDSDEAERPKVDFENWPTATIAIKRRTRVEVHLNPNVLAALDLDKLERPALEAALDSWALRELVEVGLVDMLEVRKACEEAGVKVPRFCRNTFGPHRGRGKRGGWFGWGRGRGHHWHHHGPPHHPHHGPPHPHHGPPHPHHGPPHHPHHGPPHHHHGPPHHHHGPPHHPHHGPPHHHHGPPHHHFHGHRCGRGGRSVVAVPENNKNNNSELNENEMHVMMEHMQMSDQEGAVAEMLVEAVEGDMGDEVCVAQDDEQHGWRRHCRGRGGWGRGGCGRRGGRGRGGGGWGRGGFGCGRGRAIVRFVKHVTLPDEEVVPAGAGLTKTWRVRNDSQEAWAEDCELVHIGGDSFSVQSPSPVRGALRPGAEMDITVGITAPSQPGTYQGFWRLSQKGGKKFGQRLWVSLVVGASSSSESDGAEFAELTTPFEAELQSIKEMGFADESVVIPLLNRHKGNIERVVAKLTNKAGANGEGEDDNHNPQ